MIFIVGETIFPDTAAMIAARNAAAQSVARQNVSILNVEAARQEALKRSQQGQFITVPTGAVSTIVRSNSIGYVAPSVQAMRNLTPNGPSQQAMMSSMQTPTDVNKPLFTNATSRPVGIENQNASIQAADKSRGFLTGVGYRRSL